MKKTAELSAIAKDKCEYFILRYLSLIFRILKIFAIVRNSHE